MKNKLQKGMALILTVLLASVTIMPPVKAYEVGEYAKLENFGYQSCMNWNGGYLEIEQMMFFDGNKNFPSYYYTYQGTPCYQNRKTIRQGELAEDNLRKIILAGYPYHSYLELGCSSEYPAYLATQLCILEYTQEENLGAYQACNAQGYEVENAIRKIKENMANQYQIGQVPIFEIVENSEWEDYPYDPNYIYKTMHIQCMEYYPGVFTVQAEDRSVEILNEANYPHNSFYPDQTWRIRLPKTVQETGLELKVDIRTTHDTDTMWLASSTENGEMFIITQDREEIVQKTYKETIEKVEENTTPENPEGGENKEDQSEKKEPTEEPKPDDKKEETQKPEENPSEKEEKPTTENTSNDGKINQNENNNQNEQQVDILVQPNITIQNEIKPNNQTNVMVTLQVNPEIFEKKQNENLFQNIEGQNQTTAQPRIRTSNANSVITASKINTKKLPRTGS